MTLRKDGIVAGADDGAAPENLPPTGPITLPRPILAAVERLAALEKTDATEFVMDAVESRIRRFVGDTDAPERPVGHGSPFRKRHSERNAEVMLRQDDALSFTLLEPFRYVPCDKARALPPDALVVPAGNKTDLASIPGPFQWLVPRYGRHTLPALLHDHLQNDKLGVSKAEADDIFRDAMQGTGVPFVRQWAMWGAVSLRSLVIRSRLWWVLIVLWALVYGIGAGVAGWIWAATSVADLDFLPALVLLGAMLTPIATSVLWGGRYRVGLTLGLALPLITIPMVGVALGVGAYLGSELLAKLAGKGGAPIRTETWREQLRLLASKSRSS